MEPKTISLGDLNRDHNGLLAMPPGADLADYSRIDISLQPFNGSLLHSRDSVVRARGADAGAPTQASLRNRHPKGAPRRRVHPSCGLARI